VEKGLNPDVRSVASVFVSRWDKAVSEKVSDGLKNKLGLATSQKTYEAYQQFLQSNRVQRVMNLGVSPQRLLWASTGAKDPAVSDVIYIENLVAPFTVNTMPENTLLAFADHGKATQSMPFSCTDTDALLNDFKNEGINISQLAQQLQNEGAESFVGSWNHLLKTIGEKRQNM
jgi:transaldolase